MATTAEEFKEFIRACTEGAVDVIQDLYANPTFNPNEQEGLGLIVACRQPQLAVVEKLCNDFSYCGAPRQ